jgi:hypothetical protein
MWLTFFQDQQATLRAEDESIQAQLRNLSDAPEKDKAGKGGSKESPKEKEEQLTKRQTQVSMADDDGDMMGFNC